jgi:hypothetical protein
MFLLARVPLRIVRPGYLVRMFHNCVDVMIVFLSGFQKGRDIEAS